MPTNDAATVAQLAVRLGLVSREQMQEFSQEVNGLSGDPFSLLRALERKGYLTPWQSHKLLKGDNDGYFLGGYRILYKIASGSFGRVFRADDPRTGEVVAIKVLRQRWSDDPHNIELFEREGKLGKSLRHPNIVSILEVSRDPASEQYYIVMEFVEGGNLRDFLAIRKKLEPDEALRLLEDAVSGLAYAYSRGLAHRDIKLTNILISAHGAAKLVDFGLAAIYSQTTRADGVKMDRTVDYAGLEKATGVKSGDVRSDIYFLGCVLYEMLSGRPPLEMTKDRRARMQKQRFDAVTPLRREEVNATPQVFRLVETMMAFNPLDRYQTPAQVLEAIREARRLLSGDAKPVVEQAPPELPTLFVIEKSERLREEFRDKMRKLGYRVLLASDPSAALLRFRQQPCDALILDAASLEEDDLIYFDRTLAEAGRKNHPCVGIVILSESQSSWAQLIQSRPEVAVMNRPVTLKQLAKKLRELMAKKNQKPET
jgi:serine/threonine protein kinase